MSLSALLDRLQGVRPAGAAKWMAKCPAHEDRRPSLALRELTDGRILLHCFAGCETDDVLAAVGLEFRDLMPECLGEFKPERRGFTATDALRALSSEAAFRHAELPHIPNWIFAYA